MIIFFIYLLYNENFPGCYKAFLIKYENNHHVGYRKEFHEILTNNIPSTEISLVVKESRYPRGASIILPWVVLDDPSVIIFISILSREVLAWTERSMELV